MDDYSSLLGSLDRSKLISRLSDKLVPASGTAKRDRVWLAWADVFLVPLLLACVSPEGGEATSDLDPWEVMDTVFPTRKPEVQCAVSSSMVSGVWGMDSIELDGRGYFVECPESDTVSDAPFRLLGAWEPLDDELTYRDAFIETYVRFWADIGLPPYHGEHARGPLDLMVEAVMRIGGPASIYEAWDPKDFDHDDQLDRVADVSLRAAIPEPVVREVLTELGQRSLDVSTLGDDERGRAFLAITLDRIDTSPF